MAESTEAAAPRAFWSGTITFGLVSVPVDLYPAVRTQRVPLRVLGPEGQPLERRYFCKADGQALGSEHIVRGHEAHDGSFTVVSDEELDALEPEKSRDIDLRRFVPRERIAPELLERPYVLAPAGESTKAYHLLAATMERTGRAGIATFVMRGKEYLCGIFAEGSLLRAVTMRFVDELRTPASVGLPAPQEVSGSAKKRMASALAKLEEREIDRAVLEDGQTRALLELAERKRSEGRDVVEVEEALAEDEPEASDVIDIMSVLRERMAGSRGKADREAGSERNGTRSRARGGDALQGRTKSELYERAKKLDVPNRSKLSKQQLIEAIRKAS